MSGRKFEADLIAAIGDDAWEKLTPAEQAKHVESARSAYFRRLAWASAIARRRLSRSDRIDDGT